ncbi:MAG TPA: hypothetical protein VME92_00175 [Acetobacteraceae bacterium]|nr:hypothetical protein [Acetobacteraceae bacterium]
MDKATPSDLPGAMIRARSPGTERLATLLACLELSPGLERWLVERIRVAARTIPFEDAAYTALREVGHSDRSARMVLLAARRTDPQDPRRRRAIRRAMARLGQGPATAGPSQQAA